MRPAPVDPFAGGTLFKVLMVVIYVFGDVVFDVFPDCRNERDVAFDASRHDNMGIDIRNDNMPDLRELLHDPVRPDVYAPFI